MQIDKVSPTYKAALEFVTPAAFLRVQCPRDVAPASELPPELQAEAVLGLAIEQSAAVQGAAGRARRVHARHCGPRPRRSARRAAERGAKGTRGVLGSLNSK